MRFAFIAAEKARHSVTRLCRCLRVTPSGFYAWTKRGLSARAQRDVVLRTKLRAFHAASGHRYGRPNLWKDLQEDGEAVSEKRVARLMQEEGIRGKVRRRFKNTTMSDHADPIAPNVLNRDFTAAGPNQRWVVDTSEFLIGEHGKLYLAAILDLYSRFVVGWAISAVSTTAGSRSRPSRWRCSGAVPRPARSITQIVAAPTPARTTRRIWRHTASPAA